MRLPALRADRPTIVVGTCAGFASILVLACIVYFLSMRQEFVREIESIEPRTARLLGILESAGKLEAASAAAQARLRDLAFPSGRDSATVAASLQQNVRELMNDAGISVTGSQILATRSADGYDRLTLDITGEGNIEALDNTLAELELMRPLVFVESLKIKPVRMRRGSAQTAPEGEDPRRLNARFQLFALRMQR